MLILCSLKTGVHTSVWCTKDIYSYIYIYMYIYGKLGADAVPDWSSLVTHTTRAFYKVKNEKVLASDTKLKQTLSPVLLKIWDSISRADLVVGLEEYFIASILHDIKTYKMVSIIGE